MALLRQRAELAQLRHHVAFYDVDDDIHNNRKGKNNGEKFKESELVRLDRYRVPEERQEAEQGRQGQLHREDRHQAGPVVTIWDE